jgi:hypothetical protein
LFQAIAEFGGMDRDVFMFDRDAETMPRIALAELQSVRLRQTLEYAFANVAQHRKKFDAAGVKPGDCKSLADLERFPFTQKSDLRDNYPFGMFAVPREERSPARARGRARSSTTPTATACSPAASACTTAPSGSVAPWCPCRAAAPSAK